MKKQLKKNQNPKIVITGGPSAGKTTVTEILNREFKNHIAVVPESATILFKGGLPRGPSVQDRIFQQRAIYYLQRELEEHISRSNPDKMIVCDRGALDGLAYWPKGTKETLFHSLQTTLRKELCRYDWVIHLDTASELDYKSTSIRKELVSEAQAVNLQIIKAWKDHPRQIIIPNSRNFYDKLSAAIRIIQLIMANQPYEKICHEIKRP